MDNQTTKITKDFSRKLINIVPEFQELARAMKDLDADSV